MSITVKLDFVHWKPHIFLITNFLFTLVLDGYHDDVGLVDQVGGRGENNGGLTLLEVLLQCVGELFAVLHKFSLSLFQCMFTLTIMEIMF